MATIHITRDHSLGREAARTMLEQLALKMQDKLQTEWRWDGDELVFQRTGASGRVLIRDAEVEIRIKLGLLLTPLKGTLEEQINKQIDRYLARA